MRSVIAAALVAAFFGGSIAAAQTVGSPHAATKPAEPFDQQVIDKITATLSHKGITGVSNIRSAGDGYQVSAVMDTKPVQVWVNPESGVIKMEGR